MQLLAFHEKIKIAIAIGNLKEGSENEIALKIFNIYLPIMH